MEVNHDFDFSGYATRFDVLCTDGRVISPEAFAGMDGKKVPLVWRHGVDKTENILGIATLEHRDDGMYTYIKMYDTASGKNGTNKVLSGQATALSISANNLVHDDNVVVKGDLREVSLVPVGANPEAVIDFVNLTHSEDEDDFSEAVLLFNEELELSHEMEDLIDELSDEDMAYRLGLQIMDDGTIYDNLGEIVHEDDLEHYGVLGMKWGMSKGVANTKSGYAATRKRRKEERRDLKEKNINKANYKKQRKALKVKQKAERAGEKTFKKKDVGGLYESILVGQALDKNVKNYKKMMKDAKGDSAKVKAAHSSVAKSMKKDIDKVLDGDPSVKRSPDGKYERRAEIKVNKKTGLDYVEVSTHKIPKKERKAITHADENDEWDENESIIMTGEGTISDPDEIEAFLNGEEFEFDDTLEQEDGPTMQDVFDTLDPDQKGLLYYVASEAAKSGIVDFGEDDDEAEDLNHENGKGQQEDGIMNVFAEFAQNNGLGSSLTHESPKAGEIALLAIQEGFRSNRNTFKDYLEQEGESLNRAAGISNINFLFPKTTFNEVPDFISRDMGWVTAVLDGVRKRPMSRFGTMHADITAEDARARGYITGERKESEVFGLIRREVSPTTIYKKQEFNRDDILDATTIDVITWVQAEMRMMLNEEVARVILVGDGRKYDDKNKVNENKIIPIYKDDMLYAHRVFFPIGEAKLETKIDAMVRQRKHYKGSGRPTMFTTQDTLTDMLLLKDGFGRDLYTLEQLKVKLQVRDIVVVEVMEDVKRNNDAGTETFLLEAIFVNLMDYSMGLDKGGQVSFFDFFDIDFNKNKYLYETRFSGMLTRIKSALIFEQQIEFDATVVDTGAIGVNKVVGESAFAGVKSKATQSRTASTGTAKPEETTDPNNIDAQGQADPNTGGKESK